MSLRSKLAPAALVALALIPASDRVARADEARAPAPVGAALRPAGETLVDAGVARLAPDLVAAAARPEASDAAATALARAVAGDPVLASAYGAVPRFSLTTESGLSPGGETTLHWLERARFHGLDLTPDDAANAFAGGPPPTAPPVVPAADVRAAWDASGDGEPAGRWARAVAALRARVPGLAPASAHVERSAAARVAAEVSLARGLSRLLAELPPRPRTIPVLEDPDQGYYLSPDVLWRGVPAPTPVAADLAAALAKAGDAAGLDALLTARLPQHPQYAKLVAAAERYASLCVAGEWPTIELPASDKAALEPEVAAAVAARLAREGYFTGDAKAATWDAPDFIAAVASYRDTHQLKDKLPIDKDLVQSLNVPCAERLRSLELNVRRWRVSGWTPTETWVQVNLAGQELRYYKKSSLAMFQRTVVGGNKHFKVERLGRDVYPNATPVLMDHIAQVIINPEWNVPNRIARDEISVEIAKDPNYLASKHFRVVTGKDGGTYYVQEAGPWNALGQIKILFPNSESVYLHDTPGKAAFKQAVRALSHGCVRVQNAFDFGMAILAGDAEAAGVPFDEAATRARAFHAGQSVLPLKREIPVFLEYYTASVSEDGLVRFHPDVYGYDAATYAATAADARLPAAPGVP